MKRARLEQKIVNAFCEVSGSASMDVRTMRVLASFAEQHGLRAVLEWIEISGRRISVYSSDADRGRYISGIRRAWLEEQETARAEMCDGAGI